MDAVGRMPEAVNHATSLLFAAEQPDDGTSTSAAPKTMKMWGGFTETEMYILQQFKNGNAPIKEG